MTEFRSKEIRSLKTLGDRLAEVRQEAGWDYDDVSHKTGIGIAYLRALEEGRYHDLPGDMYTKNYLRRYAECLQLNIDSVLRLYEKERRRSVRPNDGARLPRRRLSSSSFVITPTVIRRLAIGLVFLACFGYLGLEMYRSISPPRLTIEQPADQLTTGERSVEVVGRVGGEAAVRINGREVYSDPSGRFRDTIVLQEGVNVISVAASKKRGKPTIIYRSVLFKPN